MGADPLVPPQEMGAGNFVFLIEDNINDGVDGLVNPIAGDAAGHNVNAPGSGLSTDPRYPTSPGGHAVQSPRECGELEAVDRHADDRVSQQTTLSDLEP